MNVVLTVIIVVALIVLCAIVGTWILSHFLGTGPVMTDLSAEEKQATLQSNRAFALHGEYDKVGFSTVKFGYSPAQVDDLLEVLTGELQRTKEHVEASNRSLNADEIIESELHNIYNR